MKRYIIKIALLLATVTATFSCGDSYDDSKLWAELNSLSDRVSKLESTLSQMNGDIQSMRAVIEAVQGYTHVTSIVQTETGYRISFSSGNVIEINNTTDSIVPHIGSNGNWWIGTTDTGVKAAGSDGLTPHIGSNGNWWIGTTDTGVKAAGSDGVTPHIGSNGNWWIGTTDTGVKATGSDGLTPHIGSNGNWWIGTVDTGIPATGAGSSGEGTASLFNIPIIGVDLYDGVYYWTITLNGVKSWLYNTDGSMIPVVGGSGVTTYQPIIRVNANGYWVVSYDGGVTYVPIYDEYGHMVSATGGNCNCESFFLSVSYHDGILVLVLIDGTVVTIDTNNSGHDERLDDVVPPELQDSLSKYMPIFSGKNPPLIEGVYYLDPNETVYCQDDNYKPGEIISSYVMRFINQNTTNNTIDYGGYHPLIDSYEEGIGAYISGSNGNFTAFFNTIGESYGISTKTALVVSGVKTSSGVKDLYYAFVMVEKGYDPYHRLMDEGIFRVFKDKDGLSVPTAWNPSYARSTEDSLPATEWEGNSFFSVKK